VNVIDAALWGLLGGLAVDCTQLLAVMGRLGKLPWKVKNEPSLAFYVVAGVTRLIIGACVAAAAASQVNGAFGAFMFGAAAPLVMERIAQFLPVSGTASSAAPDSPGAAPPAEEPIGEHGSVRRVGTDGGDTLEATLVTAIPVAWLSEPLTPVATSDATLGSGDAN
jgi:hypothetical protein